MHGGAYAMIQLGWNLECGWTIGQLIDRTMTQLNPFMGFQSFFAKTCSVQHSGSVFLPEVRAPHPRSWLADVKLQRYEAADFPT